MNKRIISPSLLSANFTRLSEDIKLVEDLSIDRHFDGMDGHFVPNLPFVHLAIFKLENNLILRHTPMIEEPYKYIEEYAKAGSDTTGIHQEASHNIQSDLELIKSLGKAGTSNQHSRNFKAFYWYFRLCFNNVCVSFCNHLLEILIKWYKLWETETYDREKSGVNINTIDKHTEDVNVGRFI